MFSNPSCQCCDKEKKTFNEMHWITFSWTSSLFCCPPLCLPCCILTIFSCISTQILDSSKKYGDAHKKKKDLEEVELTLGQKQLAWQYIMGKLLLPPSLLRAKTLKCETRIFCLCTCESRERGRKSVFMLSRFPVSSNFVSSPSPSIFEVETRNGLQIIQTHWNKSTNEAALVHLICSKSRGIFSSVRVRVGARTIGNHFSSQG